MKTHVLIALSTLLLGIPSLKLAAETDAARVAIQAQSRAFTESLAAGDAAAAARAFTADAKLVVSGVDGVLVGREAIERFWRNAVGAGVGRLVLEAHDLEGEGDVRHESGEYRAQGRDGQTMSRGQYLIVWKREGREWKIHRDIASAAPQPTTATAATSATATVVAPGGAPDRVGFPGDYRRAFKLLGAGGGENEALVHTAYANAPAAAVFDGAAPPFPNGAVIAMEFASPLKDGEGQTVRDEQGIPLPGEVVRVDVMRRGAGYGAHYGDKRAGEWEFASYAPDGAPLMPPVNGAQCADCHRNAGANNDFVFRMRPTPGVP